MREIKVIVTADIYVDGSVLGTYLIEGADAPDYIRKLKTDLEEGIKRELVKGSE